MDRIERISDMEKILDDSTAVISRLEETLEEYERLLPDLKRLCEYYDSAEWMRDYEADEAGKLPADLKRGVLSEDAVYDLLTEHRQLLVRILKVAAEATESIQ